MSLRYHISGVMEYIEEELKEMGDTEEERPYFVYTPVAGSVPVKVWCVPDMILRGTQLEVGGKVVTIQGVLRVRTDLFLDASSTLVTVDGDSVTADNVMPHPTAGRTLQFQGKEYRILSAGEDSTRAYYMLMLVDANSGR